MLVVIVLRVLPVPVGLRSAAAKGCMFAVAVFPNRTRVLPGFDWPVVRGGVTLILWKAQKLTAAKANAMTMNDDSLFTARIGMSWGLGLF